MIISSGTPAVPFRVFPEDGTVGLGHPVRLLFRIIRTDGFGRIGETLVVAVHHHLRYHRDDIATKFPDGKFVTQGTLYHVPYRPLCFGHTEIHRHDLQFIHLASGILLQQHVAHLRTVTVAYDQIVVHGNKLQQGVAGILYVL